MTRRHLLAAPAVAALNTAAATPPTTCVIELARFQLRNGPENQRQRAADFFRAYLPIAKRAGIGPIGVFSGTVAEDSPFLLFRLGLQPVFFGQTIVGRNMPNLTYFVAHDDWAARERNWRAFGADPDWQKLRAQPGVSDLALVPNISNVLLSPLPFSEIR